MRSYFSGLFLLFSGCLFLGCAQQSTPTGGPKDVKPPELVRSFPQNQTTNYQGQRIELEFDEYVNVDNINQQLLITPALEGTYTTRVRPKGVVLNLDKPLRPNTTYSFNFRQTFKDVTERNPARNVRVVFSTGPVIDSIAIRGKITDLLTDRPVFDATVGLYPVSDTLQFAKVKPYYFSRTDSAGTYTLENLRPGQYRLAAFTDGNNNLLYDAAKERIGFENSPLILAGDQSGRNLKIAFADRSPNRVVTTRPTANYYTIVYAKGLQSAKVTFESSADSLPHLLLDEKQLRFFNTTNATDTIRVAIEAIDSLGVVFRHAQKIKFRPRGRREESTREAFEVRTNPADRQEVTLPFSYRLRFNKPIQSYDLAAVRIQGDTVNTARLTEASLRWNAYRNEVTIETPVQATKNVRVVIPRAAFLSVEQDSSQAIRTLHPLRDPENYGLMRGTLTGATTNLLVELLDGEYKVLDTLRLAPTQTRYEFRFVPAGTYFVRVIADKNGNGRWDAGDPANFEQPEAVYFYPQKIPVRVGWEVGNDPIALN